MFEEIRCRLIKQFIKRRNEVNTWPKTIAPKIHIGIYKTYNKIEKILCTLQNT